MADGKFERLEVGQFFGLEVNPRFVLLLLDDRVLLLKVVLLLLSIFQVHAPIATPSVIVIGVVILTLVALVLLVRDGKLDFILSRSLIASIGLPGLGITTASFRPILPAYCQKFVLMWPAVGITA